MGFFWTKEWHKYQTSLWAFVPNQRRENTGGKGTWVHLHIYIRLYNSVPEIFTENTIRKRSCLGNILKFIQTVYMISSK